MSDYQLEQLEALSLVRRYLDTLPEDDRTALLGRIGDYLQYRREVTEFMEKYFSPHCNEKCFQSRLSACCSKDGIITFFADVLINALVSTSEQLKELAAVLKCEHTGARCVYLSAKGCRWQLKPINCEMFLCDDAVNRAFQQYPEAGTEWERLNRCKKAFTWPDRPVLFDDLERKAIAAGYVSPLMYMHNSPGLLKIKSKSIADPNRFQGEN